MLFFFMVWRPPSSTRTDTLCPSAALFRFGAWRRGGDGVRVGGLRRAPGDEHAAGAGDSCPIGVRRFVSGGFRGNASSGQGGAFAAGREQGETGDDRQDASHGGAHRGTAWVIRRDRKSTRLNSSH